MTEEEKKRMNYETRQRKRAKKAAFKEQEAKKGKGKSNQKGKGKSKSQGKGKPAKSKDAGVHQLEQFGWLCAVGYEDADIEEPRRSLNRWQWICQRLTKTSRQRSRSSAQGPDGKRRPCPGQVGDYGVSNASSKVLALQIPDHLDQTGRSVGHV